MSVSPKTLDALRAVLALDPSASETDAARIAAALASVGAVRWIGEQEAADELGISKSALAKWRAAGIHPRAGRFPFRAMETAFGTYCYDLAAVRAYVQARIEAAEGDTP